MMPDGFVCHPGLERRVQVGHLEGVVTGLVSYGEQVGVGPDQVCDAGVLQLIELVLGRQSQSLFHLQCPEVPEMLGRMELRTGDETVTEQEPVSG